MGTGAVAVFVRWPEPGTVKTRLGASIGMENACCVYDRLVRRTLGVVNKFLQGFPRCRVTVFITPWKRKGDFKKAYPGPWSFCPQEGKDLGIRMKRAMEVLFEGGCSPVVLIGSDIADLVPSDLTEAFGKLRTNPAVMGFARDGGYYLLGLRKPFPAVFQAGSWGHQGVGRRTWRILSRNFPVATLAPRTDVDRREDLDEVDNNNEVLKNVSVIVPTLSQPHVLKSWLCRLQRVLWPGDEIIVVQGMDRAKDFLRLSGRRGLPVQRWSGHGMGSSLVWAISPVGRGVQLGIGATLATGDVLWFLHDDCYPSPHSGYETRQIARLEGYSLGCFKLRFTSSLASLRAVAMWANARSRFFQLPYGDQGLFCLRTTFERVGGFQRRFLMEDVELVRRCIRVGGIYVSSEYLDASPRRYVEKGVLRASMRNHLTLLLYHLGWDDERLYAFYYGKRQRSPHGSVSPWIRHNDRYVGYDDFTFTMTLR